MGSGKPLRIGVYIPGELADRILEIMRITGIASISRVVQEALWLYVSEHSWKTEGEVVGAVGVLYDHEVKHSNEVLTDLQHRYMDVVVTATHIHVDERNCLLLIVVRGGSGRIKALVNDIENVDGVKMVRLMLMSR